MATFRRSVQCLLLFGFTALCGGPSQQPKPQNATASVLRAFANHNIVMFGEAHGCKQEYEWLRELVRTPEFADRVDDIVVEFGNSLYQKSVDRYIAGEDLPFSQVQQAWRNVVGADGPPSPVYESFYGDVREANLKRRGKHQMRVVLGGPYADWDTIKDREELAPYLGNRDSWYAQSVKEEVLDKKRRAFLIMGGLHFLRLSGPGLIEQQLRAAGASTYLIVFGTQVIASYDELAKRFGAWSLPAIVELRGNWVGDLLALGAAAPAASPRLGDTADALLYVAPRDALTVLTMSRAELEGTAYGKELGRRATIEFGQTLDLLNNPPERPIFERQGSSSPGDSPQRVEIKTTKRPLPPRPPSR